MAGRGRGKAAFPEVRHQLRRPKEDPEDAAEPKGDSKRDENKQQPPSTPVDAAPVKVVTTPVMSKKRSEDCVLNSSTCKLQTQILTRHSLQLTRN